MRILILGAGGIGGYYGARMQQAGGDIHFLVRPARAAQLQANGLQIFSPMGDCHLTPQIITSAENRDTPFDVIFLSCKAYDLDSAIEAIAPAVGPETLIVPLLNGIRHLEQLDERFGRERVAGGLAFVSLTLDPSGEIRHLGKFHRLLVGARTDKQKHHLAPLVELLEKTALEFRQADDVEQDMWNKFIYIATLAGATCSLRAHIGEILATRGGETFLLGLLNECATVAAAFGHAPASAQMDAYRNGLIDRHSSLSASMRRDIERGGPTEGQHIVGDLFQRGQSASIATPRLEFAWLHLQAYELARQKHHSASGSEGGNTGFSAR